MTGEAVGARLLLERVAPCASAAKASVILGDHSVSVALSYAEY